MKTFHFHTLHFVKKRQIWRPEDDEVAELVEVEAVVTEEAAENIAVEVMIEEVAAVEVVALNSTHFCVPQIGAWFYFYSYLHSRAASLKRDPQGSF